jgi:iron(III) transport system substrate-binding protein
MKVFRPRALAVLLVAAAVLVVAAGAGAAKKKPKGPTLLHPGSALAALVKKAQAEGSLNFYTVPPDPEVRRVADAFTKRWGVKVTWTRFGTSDLQTRFSAEAQSGSPGADLLLLSNSQWVGLAERRGWVSGPKQVGLPGWPKGQIPVGYPKKLLTNSGSAIVQLQPSTFLINTNLVKPADAPKDWKDLLDPKWKGKIILTDPTSSPAFVDLWWAVQRKEGGIDFLKKLRGQAIRLYPGVAPLTQAVIAGEAPIAVPGVPAIAESLIAKGAPLREVTPSVTNGPEEVVLLTNKAKHPNAAKLFAWFLLTPGGQALLNADPGVISAWDVNKLPAQYTRVDPAVSSTMKSAIFGAFGVG